MSELENESMEYDREQWETLRNDPNKGAFMILKSALQMDVPREELEDFIAQRTKIESESGNFGFEYHLRNSLDINTPEELRIIGESAYEAAIAAEAYNHVVSIAQYLYGKESKQYRETLEMSAKKTESEKVVPEDEAILEERSNQKVEISANASMKELIAALDEAKLIEFFETDLAENFDNQWLELYSDLMPDQEKLANTTISEFFKGINAQDLEVYLPIKFI